MEKIDQFSAASLMWDHGIWAQHIDPNFRFEIGKKYLRMDGKIVTIIAVSDKHKGYETVQGDDGIDMIKPYEWFNIEKKKTEWRVSQPEELGFRYQRSNTREGLGRCTGSKWDDNFNLMPFYFPYLNGEISVRNRGVAE